MRFRFVQDDSAHWYVIPAEEYVTFNLLLGHIDEAWEEFDDRFGGCRIDGCPSHYTVTDIRAESGELIC